jgi:maltose/moltooligosaccharide transporter
MNRTQRLAYLGCSLTAGVFSAFNNFSLALWLSGLTTSYFVISLFGNTRSFEGAVVQPIVGAWSDRTWLGWFGRRRPFILIGGLLSAGLLAATPGISRTALPWAPTWIAPELIGLLPAVVAIFLFTLTFNAMADTHGALLADLETGPARNKLASWSVLVNMFGQFGILGLVAISSQHGIPDSAFLVTAAIMAGGVVLTVLGVSEPTPAELAARETLPLAGAAPGGPHDERGSAGKHGKGFSIAAARALLTEYRGAAVFLGVVFAYWAGVNAVMPLISIYTKDVLGTNDAEAQLLPALLLLSTTIFALPMGWLGTRFGKRRVISAGYAIMAAGAIGGLLVTTKEQGAIVFFLAGIGNAGAQVLTVPLLADLVPRKHMGLATGLLAAAGSVAAPISAFVAGALSDYYHTPRVIFAVMAAMVCVALALMPGVRKPQEQVAGTLPVPQFA